MKVAPEATVRYFGDKDGFKCHHIHIFWTQATWRHVCLSPYFMVEAQKKLLVGAFPVLHETQERLRA